MRLYPDPRPGVEAIPGDPVADLGAGYAKRAAQSDRTSSRIPGCGALKNQCRASSNEPRLLPEELLAEAEPAVKCHGAASVSGRGSRALLHVISAIERERLAPERGRIATKEDESLLNESANHCK